MTSAVLYGTTSDNELRPVRVTDSGEFVTDGGGGGDWYANLYVGGSEGDPSISLLSDGSINAATAIKAPCLYNPNEGGGFYFVTSAGEHYVIPCWTDGNFDTSGGINLGNASYPFGSFTAKGDIYCHKLHQADGFDLGKIGQALSTIHDVIESVDDLQGLKNLFHLLLDNLKSDPTPPPSPSPEPPPEQPA